MHRGVHELSQKATSEYEETRNIVGDFIGSETAEQVIFTKGTTDGINIVASAWAENQLNKGDEILITTMEHHSNIVPWQMLCEKLGAKLVVCPINAAGEILTATGVMETAASADTSPEQTALQGMLGEDEYSIDQAEVDAYNQAVAQVENYAQQAGAFMAAANNAELTASIDSYATVNNFVVGNYTAITYTQNVDEFVINWDDDGFGSGWQGYLSEDMVSASELFTAGEYVEQYGTMPN